MYYQFNNFSGRLIGSNHFQPYYPIDPRPLDKNEPSKVVFDKSNQKLAQSTSAPQAAGTTAQAANTTVSKSSVKFSTLPEKLKAAQRHFQVQDRVPVWLKGATKNKVWLGIVGMFCTFNLAWCAPFVWNRLDSQ